MLRKLSLLLVSMAFTAALPVRAETVDLSYYLPGEADYDPAIPTPASYLGFEPGEWHLRNDQIMGYLRELSNVSERMTMVEYARSHGAKPLYLVKVSHPENLARLEEVKLNQQRLAAPDRGDREGANLDEPLVVWLGYSVHGNESSGANSVPVLAYHLSAGQGADIDRLLRETIILIDPVLNPDGLDRFAHWANTHRGRQLVADRNHREHTQDWPTARSNHYWFDLNRDWLPLVHPESRGRLEKFHEWRPHILGDFHEMGPDRTYFFQPGVPARNNPLTPEANYELTARIAEFNASALDQIGSLYYTRESFDDFYLGKGSTYPDLNGSIGILYEQASSRGHVQDSVYGPVTFPFGIRNQFMATLGTLEASLVLSRELKEYSRWFYDSVAEEAAAAPVQAYVVEASKDPVRNSAFLDLLLRHQVQVHNLAQDVEVNGKAYQSGASFVIPVQQPQFRLIKSLFERLTSFEENVFYDVSTWVLPPAFNLDYGDLAEADFSETLLGDRIEDASPPQGELSGRSNYGYAFGWKSFDSPRVLHFLLKNGLKAKAATRPFTSMTDSGPQSFTRGGIFVPVSIQNASPDRIFELMAEAASLGSVDIYAVTTGLAVDGIDLGSPSFEVLEERKVLIAVGDGISSLGAGETWHLLDQRVEMAVSLVELSRLNRMDLSDYDVIIFPDGSYSSITDSGAANLERWIRRGGTLIATQRAARWAVSQKLAKAGFIRDNDKKKERERLPYGEADSIVRLQRISGAIFSAHVDSTHPIGFGFEDETVRLFRQGTLFMEPSENPYQTPVLYEAEPLVSGYVSEENLEHLANSAAVIVDPLGSGQVVLFADNPNFRGYWLGGSRLFLNAVFFGSTVSSVGGADEAALEEEH